MTASRCPGAAVCRTSRGATHVRNGRAIYLILPYFPALASFRLFGENPCRVSPRPRIASSICDALRILVERRVPSDCDFVGSTDSTDRCIGYAGGIRRRTRSGWSGSQFSKAVAPNAESSPECRIRKFVAPYAQHSENTRSLTNHAPRSHSNWFAGCSKEHLAYGGSNQPGGRPSGRSSKRRA